MVEPRSSILQGTLDLMVLTTLEQLGPMYGYGIARRLEQVGQQALVVNQARRRGSHRRDSALRPGISTR
jgi:hypothetical protein